MSHSRKLVVLGTTTLEVETILALMSQAVEGSEVSHGEIAGSRVSRFSSKKEGLRGAAGDFKIYATSMECDFRGIFTLLVKNADGVIGVVPADAGRITESRKVLTALHRALEVRRKDDEELPFVIQYHWPLQSTGPSPEEMDELLGVNPQVVKRCFSRADGKQVTQGFAALFEELQRLKSSPK